MIVTLVLSLLTLGAPRASAAVAVVEPVAPMGMRAASMPVFSAVSPPVLSAALASAAVPLAAPSALVAAAPSAAAAAAQIPAVAAVEDRPASRLRVLSFEELGGADQPGDSDGPRRPAGESRPFLYRHYRFARAVVAPVLRLFYGIRVEGFENLPDGPALIVPNHVSFLDPVLISYAANRPMRFLMYRPIYETRGFQRLFRSLGAIPISTKDPKEVIEDSLNRARRALAAGETVVIFPEGTVTRDGDFSPFRRGFERMALGLGVPVVPAGIGGMWGSLLSRHPLRSWTRSLLARLRGRRKTAVRFGPPLERADAGLAREAVAGLVGPR